MPCLPGGVRLTESAAHGGWALLGPGQVFKVDAFTIAVLERCSGTATFAAIVDDLSKHYGAPPRRTENDVGKILQDLLQKNLVVLSPPAG